MKELSWKTQDLRLLIAVLESGGRPKGGADDESGEIPSLGGENITSEGGIDVSTVRKVPRSFFQTMRKGILRDGDVLINKDGANTGKVGQYRGEFPEAAINEHVFRLRGYESELENGFLFYFLASQVGQAHIRQRISGSAQPGLKSNFVDEMPIALPAEFNHQTQVVRVLTTIDRAIEQSESLLLKQQRIKTGLMHDLLTRGLDAEGRLRDPATHQFKESSVGPIPVGWDEGTILTKAEIHNNLRKPLSAAVREQMKGVFPYYGPTGVLDYINEYRLDGRFVLIGEDGDHFLKFETHDMTQLAEGRFNVNNHAHVLTGKNGCSTEWLHHFFRHRDLTYFLTRQGAGRFKLNKATLLTLPLPTPSPDEQERIATRLLLEDSALRELKETTSKLRRLKSGLMHDLLTGTVPVTPLLSEPSKVI